jgi:hypothetical protein
MALPNLGGTIGALFSIIPTMLVLYFMLRRYDRFFEERRLALALLVGLLIGAAVTLVEVLFAGFHEPRWIIGASAPSALLLLVISYPLIETAGKLVGINWRTYQGRRDTPYYAVGIGLGFAGINVFIIVARGVTAFAEQAQTFPHWALALIGTLYVLLFSGGIMIHGFSAVVMGRAVADRDPLRAFFYGMALLVPYYVGYWALNALPLGAVLSLSFLLSVLIPMAVFAYGVLGVRYVIRNILEEVVPARERRRLLREMDRAERS